MTKGGTEGAGARIRVGVAGWYYPDWRGVVYPSGERRSADQLRYLAEFVDVIEINNTFYRPPSPGAVDDWRRRVAGLEDFRFNVKLWRRFTHDRQGGLRHAELEDFLRRVGSIFELGPGGVLLAQFPHSFHNTAKNFEYLGELLDKIGGIPVAVELRHNTWDNPEAFAMLEERGAGLCSIDHPLFRGSIKPLDKVTSGVAYIRFHGRNKEHWFNDESGRDERYDYLYSPEELGPWIERARSMAEKAGEVYVITNNHFRGQAVCNAIMLKAVLTGRRALAPSSLLESFPELSAYADPDAPVQEKLF
jgi:uncharacterized protein YecE (DUF72 family)